MRYPAIHGLQLERTAGVYQMSWWMREGEGFEWQQWTLRLTKAEADMVLHCDREQIWTPEFEALLKRGAPPIGRSAVDELSAAQRFFNPGTPS